MDLILNDLELYAAEISWEIVKMKKLPPFPHTSSEGAVANHSTSSIEIGRCCPVTAFEMAGKPSTYFLNLQSLKE